MLSGSVLHLDEFALHLTSLGQVPSYTEGPRGYTVQHFFGRILRQINCVDDVSLVLSEP
jgi:hypothetical protein